MKRSRAGVTGEGGLRRPVTSPRRSFRSCAVARWPQPRADYLCRDLSFRDYFEGARQLAGDGQVRGYLSRAFRSEADGQFRLAVPAPLFSDHRWSGVVMATLGTATALVGGLLSLALGLWVARRLVRAWPAAG